MCRYENNRANMPAFNKTRLRETQQRWTHTRNIGKRWWLGLRVWGSRWEAGCKGKLRTLGAAIIEGSTDRGAEPYLGFYCVALRHDSVRHVNSRVCENSQRGKIVECKRSIGLVLKPLSHGSCSRHCYHLTTHNHATSTLSGQNLQSHPFNQLQTGNGVFTIRRATQLRDPTDLTYSYLPIITWNYCLSPLRNRIFHNISHISS